MGGWSFSLYLIQLVFKNLREIGRGYWQYGLGECSLGQGRREGSGGQARAVGGWGTQGSPSPVLHVIACGQSLGSGMFPAWWGLGVSVSLRGPQYSPR